MKNLVGIMKKYFMSRKFEDSGFEYTFLNVLNRDNVEISGDFGFIVNVKLPDPNQSYFTAKFNDDIMKIISNFQNYLGEGFSYSLKLLIEGDEHAPDLYIRPELIEKLLENFNQTTEFFNNDILFKVVWYKPENDFYNGESENVEFNLNFDVVTLMPDDPSIGIDMDDEKVFKKLSKEIYDTVFLDDETRQHFETICHDILEDELKLSSVEDSYYMINYDLEKILGRKVFM
jgi:hypothetical protein